MGVTMVVVQMLLWPQMSARGRARTRMLTVGGGKGMHTLEMTTNPCVGAEV